MKNNVKVNGALLFVILALVGGLLWGDVQGLKDDSTNRKLALTYMSEEHPDLNCVSVKVYDESNGDIRFVGYDSDGNPKICAGINKEYYMDKYFE